MNAMPGTQVVPEAKLVNAFDEDASRDALTTQALQVSVPDADLLLWQCSLALPESVLNACEAALSPSERARAARFGKPALRQRYVAGRGTLRVLLGQELGMAPAEVPIGHGARGRPALEPPHRVLDFNVSHTRDVALIAILRTAHAFARIGIDIEHEERVVDADRLARRYLTVQEREDLAGLDGDARRNRFIRLWTAKEAMSKATGDGLAAPMGRLDVDLTAGPRLVAGPPPYTPAAWRLISVPLTGGFVATAARWSDPCKS